MPLRDALMMLNLIAGLTGWESSRSKASDQMEPREEKNTASP